MNRAALEGYTKVSGKQSIYITKHFQKELPQLLSGLGPKEIKAFNEWLYENIELLDTRPSSFLYDKPKIFEPVKNCKDIFSMRCKKIKNIRILFQVTNIDGRVCVLLIPFNEFNTSDYNKAIIKAENRKIHKTK